VNSIRNLDTQQTGSRIGGTISILYSKHQSVKISYSDGAYIRFGGNYQSVSAPGNTRGSEPNGARVLDLHTGSARSRTTR